MSSVGQPAVYHDSLGALSAGVLNVGTQGANEAQVRLSDTDPTGPSHWIYVSHGATTGHRLLKVGDNVNGGGKIDAAKTGWAMALETHFDTETTHPITGHEVFLSEWNLDYYQAGTASTSRPIYVTINDETLECTIITRGHRYWSDDSGNVLAAFVDGNLTIRDGAQAGSAKFGVYETAQSSGKHMLCAWQSAAHTGITDADAPVVQWDFSATRTHAAGTALATIVKMLVPALAFATPQTVDVAAAFYINRAPVAGANATITKSFGLWTDAPIYVNGNGSANELHGKTTFSSDNDLRFLDDAGTNGVMVRHSASNGGYTRFDPVGTMQTIWIGQYFKFDYVNAAGVPAFTYVGVGDLQNTGFNLTNVTIASNGARNQNSPILYLEPTAWDSGNNIPRYMPWAFQARATGGASQTSDLVIGGTIENHSASTQYSGALHEILRLRYTNGGSPALACGFFGATPVAPQVSGGTTAGVIAGLVALGLFTS